MKLCKKCLLTKELTDFSKKLNGLQPICKECDKKRRKLYCKENPEKIKESNKKWQLLNKDRQIKWRRDNRDLLRERSLKYRLENPDKFKQSVKNWRLKNKEVMREHQAHRRALLLNATPSWLTEPQKDHISQFYKAAHELTLFTGIPHQVDHIEPLKGVNFRGLHVPWNLQILTANENRKKNNNMIFYTQLKTTEINALKDKQNV